MPAIDQRINQWKARWLAAIRRGGLLASRGRVHGVSGPVVQAKGVSAAPHNACYVEGPRWIPGYVFAVQGGTALLALLADPGGVRPGAAVECLSEPLCVPVGPALLGRVISPLGAPLDEKPPPAADEFYPIFAPSPAPRERDAPIAAMPTGVRAIDALFTLARGQRMAILGPAGSGKSVLLRMIAAHAECDVVVLAMVSERGREVVQAAAELSAARPGRFVIIASLTDDPPAARVATAFAATAIAEYFRDRGHNVLLCVDSLTRLAYAQRELGLAAGEPAAINAYPPSLFSAIPRLIERAGPARSGQITAFYTILADSPANGDPVAETALASLDGHIALDSQLAGAGIFPAIGILQSLSRLMPQVVSDAHLQAATAIRRLAQAWRDGRDLVETGLYRPGSNPTLDQAIRLNRRLPSFLAQTPDQAVPFHAAVNQLLRLVEEVRGDG